MKLKHILSIAAIVASLILGFWSCKQTAKYKALKADYAQFRKIVEADKQMSVSKIAELAKGITVKDENIAKLTVELAGKKQELAVVSKRLDELQHAEPATTPDIEAMPIVINLRRQIIALTKMFNLSQDDNNTKDKIIAELGPPELVGVVDGKKVYKYPEGSITWSLNSQFNEAMKMYGSEHSLRLKAEDVIKAGESKLVISLFGLKINLLKDVIVPGGTFALGYALGSKR